MHAHGPSCLPGPVTRDRPWWSVPAGARYDAPVRHHLVERVRREIAAGTYETAEKLEAALEHLLRRLDEP